ncbi:MAG TPA: GNAT family N-acetyltransferase [Trueperaceae bacterium]
MLSSDATYRLERFSDPAAFRARAWQLLLAREATHCLQLGILGGIETGEWPDPFLGVVSRHLAPALVAMRTPPHNLLLSKSDDLAALEPLLSALDPGLGGVLGPREVADAFAHAWTRGTGARAELTFRQRIYRLERVEPVRGVEGRGRSAGEEDRPLLEEWMAAFLREALPAKRTDARTTLNRWLNRSGSELRIWEAGGQPVAMAGAGSRTPHGVRISAVYTPPSHRRNGYASALVAELSQRQLDSGRSFCFLFTDLANPTSNRIYQALGYRPDSVAHEYRFIRRRRSWPSTGETMAGKPDAGRAEG